MGNNQSDPTNHKLRISYLRTSTRDIRARFHKPNTVHLTVYVKYIDDVQKSNEFLEELNASLSDITLKETVDLFSEYFKDNQLEFDYSFFLNT
jgi:hypothetical protein